MHLWQLGVCIQAFRRSRRWLCHSCILHVVFGTVACVQCLRYCQCALTFAAMSIEEGVGWVSLGIPCSSGRRSFCSGMRWLYLCRPERVEDGRDMGGGAASYEREEKGVAVCLRRPQGHAIAETPLDLSLR